MSLTFVNTNLVETIVGYKTNISLAALSFVSDNSVAIYSFLTLNLRATDPRLTGRHGFVMISFEDNLGNVHDSLSINVQDQLFNPLATISINVVMQNALGGATTLVRNSLDTLSYKCGTDKFGGAGGKAIIEMGGFAGQTPMDTDISAFGTGTGNRLKFQRVLSRGGHFKIEMPFVIA